MYDTKVIWRKYGITERGALWRFNRRVFTTVYLHTFIEHYFLTGPAKEHIKKKTSFFCNFSQR